MGLTIRDTWEREKPLQAFLDALCSLTMLDVDSQGLRKALPLSIPETQELSIVQKGAYAMRARRTILRTKIGKTMMAINLLTRREGKHTEYSVCRGRAYAPSVPQAIREAPKNGGFHLAGEHSNPDDPRIGISRTPALPEPRKASRKASLAASPKPRKGKGSRKAR